MVSVIIAILLFSILIITHELGHFLFAKRAGIGVTEFSVGMGPRLASFVRGETRYSLKAIPFGGSCAMIGEDEDSDADNAFNKKSVWARILVVVGGPMFNILTAFILSLVLIALSGTNPPIVYRVYEGYGAEQAGLQTGDKILSVNGKHISIGRDLPLLLFSHPLEGDSVTVEFLRDGNKQTVSYDPNQEAFRLGISYYADASEAVLSDLTEGSPAAEAGLRAGDVITAINGTEIHTGEEIAAFFQANPLDGSPISVSFLRNGEEQETSIVPAMVHEKSLGFEASYYREKAGFAGVIGGAFQETGYWLRYTFMSLRMLLTGGASVKDMSGPVGIVSSISKSVQSSAQTGILDIILNLLGYAILLSANLGVLNLLPIPALDGGRLLFLLVEAVRRKPLPPEKEGLVHTIGFVLLMALMVIVLFNDIVRLLGLG